MMLLKEVSVRMMIFQQESAFSPKFLEAEKKKSPDVRNSCESLAYDYWIFFFFFLLQLI